MNEERFRVGDRVDFNNSHNGVKPNGTHGTVRRVIIKRVYVVAWDDKFGDPVPYEANDLIRVESKA